VERIARLDDAARVDGVALAARQSRVHTFCGAPVVGSYAKENALKVPETQIVAGAPGAAPRQIWTLAQSIVSATAGPIALPVVSVPLQPFASGVMSAVVTIVVEALFS
jgi:hypothetical protein